MAWLGIAERKPATRGRPSLAHCRRPCVREPRGLVVGGGSSRVGSGQGPNGLVACNRASPGRGECVMSGLRARVCVFVCTRRARRARTFTSDETAVKLPRRSPGAVTRPAPMSAPIRPAPMSAPIPASAPPVPPSRQPGTRELGADGQSCPWESSVPRHSHLSAVISKSLD